MEQQDKINAYLRGKLSAEAAAAFRHEMEVDAALADWVRTTKQLMLLEELEAREKIRGYLSTQTLPPRKRRRRFYIQYRKVIAVAAVMLPLVVSGIWILVQGKPEWSFYTSTIQNNRDSMNPVNLQPEYVDVEDTAISQPYYIISALKQQPNLQNQTLTWAEVIQASYQLLKSEEQNRTAALLLAKADTTMVSGNGSAMVRGSEFGYKRALDSLKENNLNARILRGLKGANPDNLFIIGLKYFKQDSFVQAAQAFDAILQQEKTVKFIANGKDAAEYYKALSLLGTKNQKDFVNAITPILKNKRHTYNAVADSFYIKLFNKKYKK